MFPQPLRNFGVAALLSAGVALTGAFATGCSLPSDTSDNAAVGRTAAAPAAQTDAQPGQVPLPPGPRDPNMKCTDQYDYSADSRSNAEINSVSDTTCPPIQHG
ncbi:hypothetical protein [Saccharopolyspora rosea]|uniref:Lipoprotein n=1 Tax=Saccharopolyspora rosea TaxID=524884 RepID=A0ABW3FWV9_9PSEU|nr:hypothetical protein [Saccharopolyspora rosea]